LSTTRNQCYKQGVLAIRVLGPLEVEGDRGAIALGGQKQRALLGLLTLNAGRVVSTDKLLDELWGEHPPRTAATSLQNMVSQLRKALGHDRVKTRAPGYLLDVSAEETDLGRFDRLLQDARELDGEARAKTLSTALALWRGAPLAEFAYEAFAQGEIRRLEELRLSTLEERIDADLECGRHAELVGELEPLVAAQPFRERLRGQLMVALYRSGRQAESLQVYHDGRRVLVDELGIEPGRPLQELFSRILRQDPELELGAEGEGRPSGGEQLEAIKHALVAGRLVVVLGPGVNAGEPAGNGNGLPVRDELTARLADVFGCPPDHAGELTKVAQYVAVTRGVGPLYDELHALLDGDHEPGPVHRFLAELPPLLREQGVPQPLIVTTNYDRAVERAFRDAGEPVDVVTYVSLGRDRGRFLHRTAEGDVRMITTPNAYADVPLDDRPVLLKIHGEVDLEPARDAESFVVSEDDYIGYLAETGIGGVLPVTVAARLRRSHFLFLGYGLVDWSFRVFLHRLWPDEQPAYCSWAVQPGATGLEREFWRKRAVELVDLPLDREVDQLRTMIATGLEPLARR
jgi:DNA-binding SARP family transcriptional activator